MSATLGCAALLAGLSLAGPIPTGVAGSAAVAVESVSPGPGQTVGVAHPVTVTFADRVESRAAAERTVTVRPAGAPAPAAGSFTWLDDQMLEWTPAEFLPAHTPITVSAGGFATSFQTGSSVVSVADVSDYSFTVSIDGEVARQMPASMGKSKFPTPIGQFTALEKQRNVTFDSR
ncbi:hypothetical protein C6A85_94385, partial [Mycobacterium sp. ITM-2017-0098]